MNVVYHSIYLSLLSLDKLVVFSDQSCIFYVGPCNIFLKFLSLLCFYADINDATYNFLKFPVIHC